MVAAGSLLTVTSAANATAYTFTHIDVPGASGTLPQDINNSGQIVGFFDDRAGQHGFLDIGDGFTTIEVPGATSTLALGINGAG